MTPARLAEIVAAMRSPDGWAGTPSEMSEALIALADEADRLRTLLEPTHGDLINRAASLGSEAVKMRERAERMDAQTHPEARALAFAAARRKAREADDAWAIAREATETGGVP